MESHIKVKATFEQMEIFCCVYCVKQCSRIKWLNDGKNRWLYEIILRHNDDAGELHGTYTVETIMRRFREDADVNLPYFVRKAVRDTLTCLSVLGERERLAEVFNVAMQEYGLKVKVA